MVRQSSAELLGQMGELRYELIPANRIVERAIASLPSDATLTITCSPTKGVDETIETSIELASQFARVIPHIAARMIESEEHLEAVIDKLLANNLDEIFVVGSDQRDPLGPYRHGHDLLQALASREHGLKRIGFPAYPEGHPDIDSDILAKDFEEKAQLANYAVTQMCFDPEQVLTWLKQQRAAGVRIPIYLGIPGPVKPDKLVRTAARIGVTDSIRFLRKNLKLTGKMLRGYDVSDLLNAYAPYLNDSDNGIAGFHIYTFNELDTLKNFSGI